MLAEQVSFELDPMELVKELPRDDPIALRLDERGLEQGIGSVGIGGAGASSQQMSAAVITPAYLAVERFASHASKSGRKVVAPL